jgi:biotin transport system substrate-specific component
MKGTPYPRSRGLAISATFAALISLSAIVSIPIPYSPVPITLQVLAIYLTTTLLGPVYGALACLIYLVIGAAGLPVYAGANSGVSILLGPTGGYLFSYPIAALLGGLVSRRRSNSRRSDIVRVSIASAVALVVIYAMGVVWLGAYLRTDLFKAVLLGAVPFIPVDVAKAFVAIPIAVRIRRARVSLPVNSG